MRSITTQAGTVHLQGLASEHRVELSVEQVVPGVDQIRLRARFGARIIPPRFTLEWSFPARDVHAHWSPLTGQRRGNDPDWDIQYDSRLISGAPVHCLYSYAGRNRLTFAFSDATVPVLLKAGLAVEDGCVRCSITVFAEPVEAMSTYDAIVRFDTRDMPFSACLDEVQKWWSSMSDYAPAAVPDIARLPVYSTWYGFFRDFDPEKIEPECRLAKELGCATVAVDDGWQTDDRGLDRAYCGSWTAAPNKIGDMRAHVAAVHAMGMKYILWYSLPHVSGKAPEFRRFEGKYLDYNQRSDLWTLDPRYPDVREHLISRIDHAVRAWDVDGVRLDFVDSIRSTALSSSYSTAAGKDTDSTFRAVDRLLTEIGATIRAAKADAFIELRHSSIGPAMRKHASILRGAECPQDSLTNRMNVLDMRLLAGSTATHSDMLFWNPDEPVESAAMQLINVLFAVPQLSIRLQHLPQNHLEMLRFYLGFWREHRDVLLDAALESQHAETLFSVVSAKTQRKAIAVCYASSLASFRETPSETLAVVNGTGSEGLALALAQPFGKAKLTVHDCCGQVVEERATSFGEGLHALAVPCAGAAVLSRES